MGHLNSVSDPGEGNLTAENKKIQMPGGVPGGMLMLQIDRCINLEFTCGFVNVNAQITIAVKVL